jgi:hypothetical protein
MSTLLLPSGFSGEVSSRLSTQAPSHAASTSTNTHSQDGSSFNGTSIAENGLPERTSDECAAGIDGQTKAVMEDANLKAIWDEEMKDFEPTGTPHRTTAVLMISWAEEASDLDTTNEVCELEKIFKEVFNYEVIKRQITGGPRDMLPGVQVTEYLVELVKKYDSDSTLLIIYYAGHGFPGKSGGLQLAG